MKNRAFLIILSLLVSSGMVFSQTGGYLSLDYSQGQEDSLAPEGTFLGLEAGLFFSGAISDRFEYFSEFSQQVDRPFRMEQVWVGFRLAEGLDLQAGLFAVPVGEYNQMNRPHLTPLIQSPLHAERLFPFRWREIGLLLVGKTRGVSYAAFIGNGLGEAENLSQDISFRDNNKNKARGGKIGISLGSGLEVSGSYYWDKYDVQNRRLLQLSALNVVWRADFILAIYERVWASLGNPDGYDKGEGLGDLILAAVNVGSFQPFVSYQRLTYQDPFHGEGFSDEENPGQGIDLDMTRWAAGVLYRPVPGVQLKMEYDWNSEEGRPLNDDLLCIQIAVHF